jgi:hypothetical protein
MLILINLRIVGHHLVVSLTSYYFFFQIKIYNQNIFKILILFLFLKIKKLQVMLQKKF